eukprot:6204400-Pleurochrysis_carterae.AAC.3
MITPRRFSRLAIRTRSGIVPMIQVYSSTVFKVLMKVKYLGMVHRRTFLSFAPRFRPARENPAGRAWPPSSRPRPQTASTAVACDVTTAELQLQRQRRPQSTEVEHASFRRRREQIYRLKRTVLQARMPLA